METEILDTISDIEKLDLEAKAKQEEIDDMYNAFKGRLKAIYMSETEYQEKQNKLIELAQNLQQETLENMKSVLK